MLSVLSINAFQIIACLLFAVITYAPLLVVLLFFSQSRWCHFNWTATDFFLSVVQPGGVTPAFKYVGWSSCHLNGARRATNQCRNHQISKISEITSIIQANEGVWEWSFQGRWGYLRITHFTDRSHEPGFEKMFGLSWLPIKWVLHFLSILQETPGDERMHPVCCSEHFNIGEQRHHGRPPPYNANDLHHCKFVHSFWIDSDLKLPLLIHETCVLLCTRRLHII